MTQKEISPLVETLGLQPHVEGGWYKRLWNSSFEIPKETLGGSYSGPRASASSIYFLLHADGLRIGTLCCPPKSGCIIPAVRLCLAWGQR